MSTTEIERPIELAPAVHRALLGQRWGVLHLPMRPQPVLTDAERGRLASALQGLGHLATPADPVAELLDAAMHEGLLADLRCPWGRGGDVLWCREPWAQVGGKFRYRCRDAVKGDSAVWLPSHRMPRAAARLVLKIDHVGVAADERGALVWRVEVEVCR